MPVPIPAPEAALLEPPGAAEVELLSRGVVSAVAPPGGLTATQRLLVTSLFDAMTGHPATLDGAPIDPVAFAEGLARREASFRGRIVQMMVLLALLLRPLPPEVATRIGEYAAELGVAEGMLEVAVELAEGHLGLAAVDFERNGYTAGWDAAAAGTLHAGRPLDSPWSFDTADEDLARRWEALETLRPGTLGRRVSEFYQARGFVYPGRPGSAPPLLTQHDWVHVLADYGTTVESELEVFAFIARANDDLHAFSLLAMVVSLFETGYLQSGAGLFEAAPGHLSHPGMAQRVADAMRRGALCEGSIDFMGIDWFELADATVEEARRHFGVPPKSEEARAAGAVGPWEPGGISPFQVRAGEALAEQRGRRYDAFGAAPAEPPA